MVPIIIGISHPHVPQLFLSLWQGHSICLLYYFWRVFIPALTDGLSVETEWQQVSTSLQGSSQYSGRPLRLLQFDGLGSSSAFQLFHPSYQAFGYRSEFTIHNWYHRHPHVVWLYQFSGTVFVLVSLVTFFIVRFVV